MQKYNPKVNLELNWEEMNKCKRIKKVEVDLPIYYSSEQEGFKINTSVIKNNMFSISKKWH